MLEIHGLRIRRCPPFGNSPKTSCGPWRTIFLTLFGGSAPGYGDVVAAAYPDTLPPKLPFARDGERAVLLTPQACMSDVAIPRKNFSGIPTKFPESRRIRPERSL